MYREVCGIGGPSGGCATTGIEVKGSCEGLEDKIRLQQDVG